MQLVYRQWKESDLSAIHNLLLETWLDAYASFIPEADLMSYHHATYNIPALTALYREAGMNGFVAEADRALVGYVRTRVAKDENRFYVPSLYILPHFQGKGIGKTLMTMAVDEAVVKGFDRIWIGIMEKNKEGLDWYRRYGYQIVEEAPFTMGKTTVNHYIGYVLVKTFSPQRLEHV
ncbi:MAG TPA: GNAT family N-acetyltransferase [Bacteroidota bacterium]|nr:GNAT family N-acetyltransferase [Bacteroidota bacterium]